MKISDLLKKDTIILDLQASSKATVIDELVAKLDEAGRLNDKEKYKEAILAREAQSTTGLGEGIAIPHAKTAAVKTPAIAFGRSISGIDYEALDGQPSQLFFMIAASEGANNEHLATLSKLSTFLMDTAFRDQLLAAQSIDEVISIIDTKEAEEADEEEEHVQPTAEEDTYIIGVTGCPTGIAHTYMAADALKKEAQERGYSIKVETNGSGGVKNRLTKEDIARADGIIVAADTKVEMDRFDGKRIVIAPVADGVRKPSQLIERSLAGKEAVYSAQGGAKNDNDESVSSGGFGKSIYKHLMNGVSNMLPFVIGGGILLAISFLFEIESLLGEDNVVTNILGTIGGDNAFALFIPVLAAFIAMSIADRPGFAPGLIAGYMAFNGDAGFLGGLLAGFLAGYMALGVKKILSGMPQSLDGLKTILFTPVLNILFTGVIMYFLIAPLASVNTGLQNWLGDLGTGNMVILGIVLGAMMAIDMGGPINKAAYTFGIAMLDAGNMGPQAAVMAAGMVPPLGIAIATTFWKYKFTKQQRESGRTNYVLGASFITEGAIPFAAADPIRVISASVVGAAIAGGLTGLFQISLPAPHGGIFTMLLVNDSTLSYMGLYAVAILTGAIVTGILYGIMKRPLEK